MNSLLPPNASALERNLEKSIERSSNLPTPTRSVLDPDTCPAALLPWLAWANSVEEWSSSWTEDQKRAVIRNAIFVHRHRGTPGAVRRALDSLGYDMELKEWFEQDPPDQPYTFRLDVQIPDTGVDQALYGQIQRIIKSAKNARSHLAGLRLTGVSPGDLFVGAALMFGTRTFIESNESQAVTVQAVFSFMAAADVTAGITVYPE